MIRNVMKPTGGSKTSSATLSASCPQNKFTVCRLFAKNLWMILYRALARCALGTGQVRPRMLGVVGFGEKIFPTTRFGYNRFRHLHNDLSYIRVCPVSG